MKHTLLISIALLAASASAQNLLICHMGLKGIELVADHPEIPSMDFSDWHGPMVQGYVAAGHPVPTVWPTVVDLDTGEQVQFATEIKRAPVVQTLTNAPSLAEQVEALRSRVDALVKAMEKKGDKLDDLPKGKLDPVVVITTSIISRASVELKQKPKEQK